MHCNMKYCVLLLYYLQPSLSTINIHTGIVHCIPVTISSVSSQVQEVVARYFKILESPYTTVTCG